MTEFYKIVDESSYIAGFGTNGSDNASEITEAEYDALTDFLPTRPTAPEGYSYVIRDNPREWVLVEVPIVDDDIDDAEAFEILFGGAV